MVAFQRKNIRTEDHVDNWEENANARVDDNRALFLLNRKHIAKQEGMYRVPPPVSTRLLELL